MQCLLSARFTMTAEVLRNADSGSYTTDLVNEGNWTIQSDPITSEIIRVWVPLVEDSQVETPLVVKIPCLVRGIVDGGIRVAGTTERFGKEYDNVDFAKMEMGITHVLTKRDRITNIRDAKTGTILWKEEELSHVDADFRATVFNVNGVTPQVDPFGRLIGQFVMLSKARDL